MNDLIAIDTETGGAGPTQCTTHAMLMLAAYYRTETVESTFKVYILPTPGLIVDPLAAAVNGYTPEEWQRREAVPEYAACIRFFSWLLTARRTLFPDWQQDRRRCRVRFLAHNSAHDEGFLNAMLARNGLLDEVYAPRDVLAADTSEAAAAARWECSMHTLMALQRIGIGGIPTGASLNHCIAWLTQTSVEDTIAIRGTHDSGADAQWAYQTMERLIAAAKQTMILPV